MESIDQAAETGARKDRKLKNFLLDQRFQLKYTGMIVGVAAMISLILGTFLYRTIQENTKIIAIDEEFAQEVARQDAEMLALLIFSFLVFITLLGLASVFVTHRMVGPIFVIRRYLRTLGEGGLPRVRPLRKGDEFVALFEDMVHAFESIGRRTKHEIEVLERALKALPAEPEGGLRQDIEALVRQKSNSLKGETEPPPPA